MFFQNYRPGKFFVSRTNPNTRFQNGKKMPVFVNWHCNKQRLFYASYCFFVIFNLRFIRRRPLTYSKTVGTIKFPNRLRLQ